MLYSTDQMCWLYSLGQMDLSLLICSMEIKLSILERGYDLAQLLVRNRPQVMFYLHVTWDPGLAFLAEC